jgi:hypothetical protein
MGTTIQECNGCGNQFDATTGALSRHDNSTKVCSSCGQDEGMAQFVAHSYNIDPQSILLGAGKIDWEILAGNIIFKKEAVQS